MKGNRKGLCLQTKQVMLYAWKHACMLKIHQQFKIEELSCKSLLWQIFVEISARLGVAKIQVTAVLCLFAFPGAVTQNFWQRAAEESEASWPKFQSKTTDHKRKYTDIILFTKFNSAFPSLPIWQSTTAFHHQLTPQETHCFGQLFWKRVLLSDLAQFERSLCH